ncbi:MAG: LPS export ABC transporter ATP-binding protein [Puniceicoccales bacterium]|jgi:lipopolysaccharide export system ATP-binding protein|nr:LPS export ABC transporter ATP-binding protein [Puniceicoccales bacterium]
MDDTSSTPPPPPHTTGTPADPGSNVIATEHLAKVYGKREVVHDVNISVRGGEVVGLLGPNGAGKTTTFYMVVGLVPATRGKVFLNGHNITTLPMWKRALLGLGYLPQEPSVFRKLTVWDNIMAVVETMPMPQGERKNHTARLLRELGLMRLANQPAYTLSGGERRRLEITRALAPNPRFMLLDEPFSGVDPISVADVQQIVRNLKKRGIGVLITDHNVRETLTIVDRAYLIYQGRVLVEGAAAAIVNDPRSRQFYLGEDFKM